MLLTLKKNENKGNKKEDPKHQQVDANAIIDFLDQTLNKKHLKYFLCLKKVKVKRTLNSQPMKTNYDDS